MRSLNPDELIRRWQLRQEAPEMKVVAIAAPIVWEVPESPAIAERDPATVIIRPWCGELLVSLGTRLSSDRTLSRRPTEAPEEPHASC